MPLQRLAGGGNVLPKRYYFNGRVYYSFSAYSTARSAYNQRQAAAANAERQRQIALAQQRARERAQAVARANAAAARRAGLAAQLQARRDLERRRAEAVRRAREALKDELARRRRRAWLDLHKRAQHVRALNRAPTTQDGFRTKAVLFQAHAASAKRSAKAQVRRNIRLTEAAKSGDYLTLFKDVRRRQKRTGGRRLDRKLYDTANSALAAEMKAAAGAWRRQVKHFYELFEQERWADANNLVRSAGFGEAQTAYVRFFGDGREPGLGQRLAALQNEIAHAQDEYLQRQILGQRGFATDAMSEAELRAAWKRFSAKHLKGQTLNQYLRGEAEAEHASAAEAWKRAMADARRSLHEGMLPVYGRDGSVSYVSRTSVIRLRSVQSLFLGGGMDEAHFNKLLGDLSGPQAYSQAALRELMTVGTDIWRRKNQQLLAELYQKALHTNGPVVGRGTQQAQAALNAVNESVQNFRRWLYEALTGTQMEGGLVGAFSDLSLQPVTGDVLNALSTGLGGVGSLVRGLSTLAGGRLTLPDVNVTDINHLLETHNARGGQLRNSRGTASPFGIDTSRAAKAGEEKALRDLMAVIGDPNADLGRKLDAIRIYGTDFASGNTAIIPQTLLDPLTFLSGTGFLRSGRLALARAGGARAAALAPRATIADFIRLSLPKHLGGLSPSRIAELTERMSIARELKTKFADVAHLSDAELVDLARGTMAGSLKEAATRGVWEKLLEASPQRAQQIFASVSNEFERRAGALGRVVSPRQLGEDVRYAAQSLRRAEREEAATLAREAARKAKDLQAEAAAKIRAERVTRGGAAPVVRRVPLSPADVRLRKQLVRREAAAVAERMTAAREAADAAKLLADTTEHGPRQVAFVRLEAAVRRLRDLEGHPPDASGNRVPGLIEQHRSALEQFDSARRFTDDTPGFVGITRTRVAEDLVYVRQQLQIAKTKLAQAVTPQQVSYWENRIKRLQAARGYLDVESQTLKGVYRASKATVKQYAKQADELIRPQQVAAKALDAPSARAELGRDLHVVAGREVTQQIAPLSAHEATKVAGVAQRLPAYVDLAAIPELDPLIQRFGSVDLASLADAVLAVDHPYGAVFDLQQQLNRAVLRAMREEGVSGGVIQYLALRQRMHLTGAGFGFRTFRRLDRSVADAIKAARGFAAKGTVKVRKGGGSVRFSAPDRGLTEIYAKVAALESHGVAVTAYDSARYVLRKPLLRHETGVELRGKAIKQAGATGGDVGEIFDNLRELRRQQEVVNNLEEYAARPANRGLTPEEVYNLFEADMLDQDLRPVVGELNSFQADVLAKAFREVSRGVDLTDQAGVAKFLSTNAPPLDNWAKARQWLVDNGHWSPRTADDIRLGQRVWSLDDERDFWMSRYGVEPEWVKADLLEAALESKDGYDAFMREVGRYDDEFERLATMSDLKPEQVRDAIVWGGDGIAQARTYAEIRQWMIDRYGPLVADANGDLIRAPWLMDPRAREYRMYTRRVFSNDPAAVALRANLGIEFDEGLVKLGQVEALGRAVERAVDKRLTRLLREGKADFDEAWLPQEQNAFVFDVVDHLLAEQSWRGFFDRKPLAGRVLDAIGTFWRAAITWTLAFPIANLIDAFGLKRLLLAATENGFRPLSLVSKEAREAIPDLRAIGMSRHATWYTKGRSGFTNLRDSQFSTAFRAREAVRGVFESPLTVSRAGEERLMLDFARTRFDDHFRALLEEGVPEESARIRAMAQARRMTEHWFPGLEGAGTLERAINQLVPFLSYNVRNKVMSITRFGLQNPWLLVMTRRLGDFVEDQNRMAWEAQHDEPFDPNDPRSRQLQIRIGDQTYAIDLSVASDWTRGVSVLFESQNPQDWVYEFFRVPHPSQAIFLAKAFGFNEGLTPWGTKAEWEDVSVWFDFASWAMGNDVFSPDNPKGKDAIQAFSQLLTFKAFSRIDPIRAKVNQYFAFRAVDPNKAREYLRDNPDLAAYFALDGSAGALNRDSVAAKPYKVSWFRDRDPSEIAAYEEALAGYNRLKAAFDAKLDQYYLRPWSAEYAEWKKKRRGVLAGYIADHPILNDVWNFYPSPSEWAEEMDSFRVDGMVDRFFALEKTKPVQDDFKTELDYARALDGWYDQRRAWLEAHPKVYDRLHYAHNAVEQAWFDHELQWSEILDQQAEVHIRLLEEEQKSAPNDAAIQALHSLQSAQYSLLDGEAFGQFYDLLGADLRRGKDLLAPRFALPGVASSLLGRIKSTVVFPGRADFVYERATPAEKREIRRRDRYIDQITSLVDNLRDPRQFWSELAKRPDLLREYLRRNPEREVDFRYATRIGAIIRAATSGKDFYDRLNADPWLKRQYFARHPDKAAAFAANTDYMSWMRRWVAQLERDNFRGADQVWKAMPAWVQDRYLQTHPDSGMANRGKGFEFEGTFFKSAASRAKYVAGVSYYAAMGNWVDLLQSKRYDEADKFFRSLPDWMREKYFAKHPDQRARFELTSEMLALGAEYFLARGGDKLKVLARSPQLRRWLNEHGGEEAEMRGFMLAAYRAIPDGEEWLRAKMRDSYPEVFGKEAQGEARLRSVAEDLAQNPGLADFYFRALRLNSQAFVEQLRRSGTPPKPLHYERKRRLARRRRRRAARFSSHWSTHRELRLGIRSGAGSA